MAYALLSNESMGRADSQGHRRRVRPGSLLATTMKSVYGRQGQLPILCSDTRPCSIFGRHAQTLGTVLSLCLSCSNNNASLRPQHMPDLRGSLTHDVIVI